MNPNNPFGSGPMKQWYHVDCFFELKKTKTSKVITSVDDVEGWDSLTKDDQQALIAKLGPDFKTSSTQGQKESKSSAGNEDSKDNSFCQFQKIVGKIADEPSYNSKSQILQRFFKEVREV